MSTLHIHVSASGTTTGAQGTDSHPLPSLAAARDYLRRHRALGQPAVVHVAPGRYELTEPLRLGPLDSHTSYVGDGGPGDVVIDGAQQITQWTPTTVNGVAALTAPSPSRTAKSLFSAGGDRLPRPRFPHDGFLRLSAEEAPGSDHRPPHLRGTDRFTFAAGDLPDLSDPDGVEAVVPHYWVAERMPLKSIDTAQHLFVSSRHSILTLRDDVAAGQARYYLDNVREALTDPGAWYLDRAAGQVLYVPRDGEDAATLTVAMPLIDQFVVVSGDAERGDPVTGVTFENLTFRHADWLAVEDLRADLDIPESMPDVDYASAPQAAANVAGAFALTYTRDCALVACRIEHVGGYGIDLGEGAQRTRVARCTLSDLGAGGIKLNGAVFADDPRANRDNTVADCEITSGGHIFPAGIGVFLRHTSRNDVVHNHIHDFHYSGISCGWIWGYAENVAKDNHLDFNHIHDIGHGLLSDMGGIYVLGVQPGTTVRGNHVHDIHCANYGGWAIYLDEGSSHVVVEGNLAHDAATQAFHQHYGRENTVRNNVFAFGGRAQVTVSKAEEHLSFTFERNIVVGNGRPAFSGRETTPPDRPAIISDLNLFFDIAGPVELAGVGRPDVVDPDAPMVAFGNDAWRALGRDTHSVVADPGFVDLAGRDFTLTDSSPAWDLGFQPLLAVHAGPRPVDQAGPDA